MNNMKTERKTVPYLEEVVEYSGHWTTAVITISDWFVAKIPQTAFHISSCCCCCCCCCGSGCFGVNKEGVEGLHVAGQFCSLQWYVHNRTSNHVLAILD